MVIFRNFSDPKDYWNFIHCSHQLEIPKYHTIRYFFKDHQTFISHGNYAIDLLQRAAKSKDQLTFLLIIVNILQEHFLSPSEFLIPYTL